MKSATTGKLLVRIALALAFAAFASIAIADGSRGGHRGYNGHGGHHHGHYSYGNRYHHTVGHYRGGPYYYGRPYYYGAPYYHGAGWYRPYAAGVVVSVPPIGFGISVLPPYYTIAWYGGVPYYHADNAYYRWYPERREYVVTRPPQETRETESAPASGEEIFVYPKNGQSESQQSDDRYECHAWAVQQSGFDPTRQNGGVADSEIESRRADYRRAEGACLEGRGYTVK
jgi:hypothetical protein